MIKKGWAVSLIVIMGLGISACSGEPADNGGEPVPEEPAEEAGNNDSPQQPNTSEEKGAEDAGEEKGEGGGEEISPVQKQMAIDVLNAIFSNAEQGIVYGLSSDFKVGESTRSEVYAQISEPEEQIGGYDYYHGAMGQASYKILYDENDVMEEARYFGTNVERQTNLGGITREDLFQAQGEPDAERKIQDTGETNLIYYVGHYELQFVIREDGSTDHVNLLEQEQ